MNTLVGAMSSLEVDFDDLEALGRRLRALRDGFNTMGQNFALYHEAIGSKKVNDRLAEVAGNWTKHRQRIGTEIEEVAGMAEGAAARYRENESHVSDSFQQD